MSVIFDKVYAMGSVYDSVGEPLRDDLEELIMGKNCTITAKYNDKTIVWSHCDDYEYDAWGEYLRYTIEDIIDTIQHVNVTVTLPPVAST